MIILICISFANYKVEFGDVAFQLYGGDIIAIEVPKQRNLNRGT